MNVKGNLVAILITLVCLSLAVSLKAQQRMIDSLLNVVKTQRDDDTNKIDNLNRVSFSLTDRGQNTLADSLARKSLALSQKLHYRKGEASAYNSIGNVYWALSNYPAAMSSFEKYLSIALEIGNKKLQATAYSHIGSIYKLEGNYPEAINAMLKSLKINEDIGNKSGIGGIYNNLGNVYSDMGNLDLGLEYYKKCLVLHQEVHDKYGIAAAYMNIGNIYTEHKQYDKALKYIDTSLEYVRELGDKYDMSILYNNRGSIYGAMHNNDKDLQDQYKALALSKEVDDKRDIGSTYIYIGDIFIDEKKYDIGRKYIDSAFAIAQALHVTESYMRVYKEYSFLDSLTNNYKAAFDNYKNYIIYRDSLQNEANTKKITQEQMQYDFDKKQAQEKAEQDKKDTVAVADKKRQTIITTSVSLVLLLVLAFSGLLLSRFRVTQKQKKVIEEQKGVVEEKNKEILDSITYAKRLQDAILPPMSIIEKHLPESFVLYKPKDIVAGDFYWLEDSPNPSEGGTLFIAACDCTGHGVPGAMVSVVCSNALNRAVKEFQESVPGRILDRTRELVLETFEKSEGDIKDGMDVSLCSINTTTQELKWAGAYNSLWYYQNGEIKETEADKQPIGKVDNPKPFKTHTLKFNKGDILYLFTDGYADQFGGPKGKKFKYQQLSEKLKMISDRPMKEQKQILEQTLEDWKGSLEQVDDILIIGIRI